MTIAADSSYPTNLVEHLQDPSYVDTVSEAVATGIFSKRAIGPSRLPCLHARGRICRLDLLGGHGLLFNTALDSQPRTPVGGSGFHVSTALLSSEGSPGLCPTLPHRLEAHRCRVSAPGGSRLADGAEMFPSDFLGWPFERRQCTGGTIIAEVTWRSS